MTQFAIATITRRSLLAVAAVLPLAASATPSHAADEITVGALRFTSHAPTFIAYEKGYFEDEGLDADIRFFQAAQPIAVAITSGDIDFGITALTGGFYNLADKGALKVIGGLYTENKNAPGMAIMASNEAYENGLKSPADLEGHSWAMTQQGSSFHYMAGMISQANDFELSEMSLKPLQKVGSMIGAVKSGQVDAMAMVPHVAVPLEEAGATKIIGWIRDLGDYQVTTIFTSTDNVDNNPDMVKRFMAAYKKAITDYREAMLDPDADPEKTAEIVDMIHKYVYADRPREEAAKSIKAGAVAMSKGAALDLDNISKQLSWFQDESLAPASLAMDEFVDSRFVD